ncbi:hypothetical protein ABIF66_001573 [Bradyrhizobium japonicum]
MVVIETTFLKGVRDANRESTLLGLSEEWQPDDGNGKDLFVHISDLRDCAGADLVSGTRGLRYSLQ